MNKLLKKQLNSLKRVEDRIIKNAAKKGIVITRDGGFSLEDCIYIAHRHSNKTLMLAQTLIDNEVLHYTSEWRKAVRDEIETRIVEKALLGVKRK